MATDWDPEKYKKITGKAPLWPRSGPLMTPGMTTRQRAADNLENARVYNAAADASIAKLNADADAREAARYAQAVKDAQYCGLYGKCRRGYEAVFGKTAGRRRRHRNKKKGDRTRKNRRHRK